MSRYSEKPKTKTTDLNELETEDLLRNTYQAPLKEKADQASIRLCTQNFEKS